MADVTFDITLKTKFQALSDPDAYTVGGSWNFEYTADADMVMVWPNPDLYMLPVSEYRDGDEYKGEKGFVLTAGQSDGWPLKIDKATASNMGFSTGCFDATKYGATAGGYNQNGGYYRWKLAHQHASYGYSLSNGSTGQIAGSPADGFFYIKIEGNGYDLVKVPAVVTWTAEKSITIEVYFDRQTRVLETCSYCGEVDDSGNVTIDESTKAVLSVGTTVSGADIECPAMDDVAAFVPEGRALYVAPRDGKSFIAVKRSGTAYTQGYFHHGTIGATVYSWPGKTESDVYELLCVFIVPDSEKLVKFGTLESMLSTYKAKSDEVLDSKLEALPGGGVSAEDVDAKVAEAVSDMDAKLADVAAVPEGGTEGQVLTKTADSYGWADVQLAELAEKLDAMSAGLALVEQAVNGVVLYENEGNDTSVTFLSSKEVSYGVVKYELQGDVDDYERFELHLNCHDFTTSAARTHLKEVVAFHASEVTNRCSTLKPVTVLRDKSNAARSFHFTYACAMLINDDLSFYADEWASRDVGGGISMLVNDDGEPVLQLKESGGDGSNYCYIERLVGYPKLSLSTASDAAESGDAE